ncbi:MAG TPA: tetratricopeptide repeat protein, partial [Phycisphaerae bacterium]|nr:tetratricopeptide repeat protein [Phycisphaerae bacterium]
MAQAKIMGYTDLMSDDEPKSMMMSVKQALNLALEHCKAGEFAPAESICQQLLVQQPGNADALYFMSLIARQKGNTTRSVELVQQAIAIKPNVFIYYQSLAATLKAMGQLEKAVGIYRKALELNPDDGEIYADFANVLVALNRWDEGLGAINTAARLKPESADIQLNLGNIRKDMDQLDAAASAFEKAIELKSDMAMPHNNLGNIYKSQGKAPEAIAEYQKAVELNPNLAQAHSNVIYVMHLDPAYDAAAIYVEALKWRIKYADPLRGSIRAHLNDQNPDRRLRIGYVSPDFREHVVGWNVLPLIREHNHKELEIYCYSGVERPDDTTARIRFYADRWRDIAKTEGDQTAKMIYDDQIDVLVDLSLHTANHRLKVFARKPAPVQATWLGYAGTTGLDTIDYRLSDPYLDPEGTDLSVYSEQTVHLPHSFWCYQPGGETINSKSLPVHNAGYITFGCLNNFS